MAKASLFGLHDCCVSDHWSLEARKAVKDASSACHSYALTVTLKLKTSLFTFESPPFVDNFLRHDCPQQDLQSFEIGNTPDPTRPAEGISETIECDLKLSSLDDRHQYEALSYVWGTHDDENKILLNGQSFTVRKNLSYALRTLRLVERPRVMWIDALCINQEDTDERHLKYSSCDKCIDPQRKFWSGSSTRGVVVGRHSSS